VDRARASEIQDNLDLAELLKDEGKSEGPDVESLSELTDELKKRLEAMELRALLNGEEDNLPCFLQIHAGAGGTESQDWASMLLRMYMRWAERQRLQDRADRLLRGRHGRHQGRDAADRGSLRVSAT
jgi:protein subunit release factor A